jgi:two-component system phosphate regulon sensor histidine kinase PhoR
MRTAWRKIARFLKAEEVPRWFGLSLVLIYLVGLGSVAQFAIEEARKEAAVRFQQASQFAVRNLADRLSFAQQPSAGAAQRLGAFQRSLRDFAANIPARWVRIVNEERRIVASTAPVEIDTIAPWPRKLFGPPPESPFAIVEVPSSELGVDDLLVRVRVPERSRDGTAATAETPGATAAAGDTLFVEALIPPEPVAASSVANHARMLGIVLIVLGALFVVYRCLREQLRDVSHIAVRLQARASRVGEDLDALRVADTPGDVSRSWNELIDLVKSLREAERKSKADEELSAVLKHAGGGALAEALCAVPDGFLYIRDEDRPDYVNTSARRLMGWGPGEAKSPSLRARALTESGERVLEVIRNARQNDGSFEARNELVEVVPAGGGDQSWFRVRLFPRKHGRYHGECVVLISDVSQQVRAERAREEFMTQVTHELRTPLTNIRAYAETLSSGMFDDPQVVTECYNVITKETRRLSRLIEDMLSVSQLEVGTVELSVHSVDLKALLTECVRDVRGLADEKNIDIQLVLSSKMDPIEGDRDKLAVVINNLLGNAIKYTPRDGNVVVGCQFSAGDVTISVKDNGIGIDAKDHARVFEKFQRADDPAVQLEAGNGIGLFTAREIVRRHNGQLELISQKGQGATFFVRLPHSVSRASAVTTVGEAK